MWSQDDSGRVLPSGTVTLLFTDIEGSTLLVRELREAYGALLDDHRRLLRESFEKAGGQEIDTQGDAESSEPHCMTLVAVRRPETAACR